MTPEALREQIATIIHPWAFRADVRNAPAYTFDFRNGADFRVAALAKADAILALTDLATSEAA